MGPSGSMQLSLLEYKSPPTPASPFIRKAIEKHGDLYDYSLVKYSNVKTKVEIVCREHGPFFQRPDTHLDGRGCPKCGAREAGKKIREKQRKSLERFITGSRIIHGDHYDYANSKYQGDGIKLEILCRIHGPFPQVPSSHLRGNGCPKCGREKTTEKQRKTLDRFITGSQIIHGDRYDYSRVIYVNDRTKVLIVCPLHGPFWQIPGSHITGDGCRQCGIKKRADACRKNDEVFIKEARAKHPDSGYDYSKVNYVNDGTKVLITCPIHGPFSVTPGSHIAGNGCKKCGLKKRADACRKSKETFIREAREAHPERGYDYSKVAYVNDNTHVTIICPLHGPFRQRPGSHIQGQGCRRCNGSISKIGNLHLDSVGVPNIQGVNREVPIIIAGKKYRVDGLLDDPSGKYKGIVYEIDGSYFHGDPRMFLTHEIARNKKTHGEIYQATLTKRAALQKAGYHVISIWDSDLIEKIVTYNWRVDISPGERKKYEKEYRQIQKRRERIRTLNSSPR